MIDLLRQRRSIRRFNDQPIASDLVDTLKEAVLRSPSSKGLNPWELVFVDHAETLETLSRARPHGSSFLRYAALGIVVCGDETRSDVWVEDCTIASIIAHLTAHSLGLGSCWIQIRRRDHDDSRSAESFVREVLAIPDHLRVEAIIGIGHPGRTKPGHPRESLDFGKIHENRYG